MININLLPKKLNEINYFKKEEKGSTLYSFTKGKDTYIVCKLEDFEIEKDFCVEEKTIQMIKLLAPIKKIVVDKTINIKSSKGTYTASLMEENCINPNFNYNNSFELETNKLIIANDFVAKDYTRPILTGVCIDNLGNIRSTDSFFAYRYIKNKSNDKTNSIVIPKDFINLIKSEFKDEQITLNFNHSNCMVQKDNIMYITRLIDGTYPNFDTIFKENEITIRFDLQDFKERLQIAKEVGTTLVNKMITLTFANNKLVCEGENKFESELEDLLNADSDYNFTLALDRLNTVFNNFNQYQDFIEFEYTSSNKPLFIKDEDNEFLLLPIRKF